MKTKILSLFLAAALLLVLPLGVGAAASPCWIPTTRWS